MNTTLQLLAIGLAVSFAPLTCSNALAAESTIYLPFAIAGNAAAPPATEIPADTPTPTDTASPPDTPTPTEAIVPTAAPTPTFAPASGDGVTLITLGEPITVDGPGAVVSGSTVTVVAGGRYRVVGALADGMLVVDTADRVTMMLDGMSIRHATGPAFYVTNAKSVSLVLADGTTNTLSDGASYVGDDAKGALFTNDTLVISGNGSLSVTGRFAHGIASDDDVVIQGGTLTLAAAADGIHANDNITVNGGTVAITRANDGLESEGTLVVNGGTLTFAVADDGMVALDTLTINGGTISVTSGVEGIESKNAIVVNDGSIAITVSDDGLNGIRDVTVNGGRIFADTRADAVDSNGTIHVNGGVIVALGGNVPEGGLDCDRCSIALDGGIVVATGGANSAPGTASKQNVVVLGSVAVGSALHIDRGGADMLTFKVSKAYQQMIFTSPAVEAGKGFTVHTGGTVTGGTEFHGLYTGATYSGGTEWANFTTSGVVTYVNTSPSTGPGGPGRPGRPLAGE